MKKIIYILGILIAAFAFEACESDITSLNVDPKNPSVLPAETFYASSQYNFIERMITPSVNSNIARLFTQQWAQTTYTDESNYDFVTRQINTRHWNALYNDVLYGLTLTKNQIDAETGPTTDLDSNDNKKAMVEILAVTAWMNLVDTFGDVPYSEALKPNTIVQPKYDDAKTIYKDLVVRLNAAMAKIKPAKKGFITDAIYAGNMTKWLKFANSVKLNLGINLADEDPALAKTVIESAVASGVFTSNDDNAVVHFRAGLFANPVYLELNGRTDFVGSNVLIDALNAKNDPRIEKFFERGPGGVYVGGIYGASNSYANFSKINETFINNETAKGDLFDYAEVCFMLAEASQRGFAVGSTAQNWYDNGVVASMEYWGVAAGAAAYLLANPYDPLAWKQSIGEQAWIANYNKGYNAWNFSRRLDFPAFVNPANSATTAVPRRMTYPAPEQSLNRRNYTAAASRINGGDVAASRVFWDKL